MSKTSLPKVAVVGRTNVGKSTLFNRLSTDVKSLVFDYEGVTRDVIKDVITWKGTSFELIDTGGLIFHKVVDDITKAALEQAMAVLKDADLILFVVDGSIGILPEDREIAKHVHKLGTPVILVANKSEGKKAIEHVHEFDRLGFGEALEISAQHGSGVSDMLELILEQLPATGKAPSKDKHGLRVVLLGKPNVGKSSLMNAILRENRAIVSPVPGTTREAFSETVRFYQEDIVVTDTPGIRRKRSVTEPLEQLMVKSSMRALDQADIILLLVDASQGELVDQELKLAFYGFQEHHKALIILFNKQDLVDERMREDLKRSLEEYEHLMSKVVTLDISCKTGKNIGRIVPLIEEVAQRYRMQVRDDELTMLFKEALEKRPLFKSGHQLYLKSAHQMTACPPTIALRVNIAQLFEQSHLTFFEAAMRKHYDLRGVPVKLIVQSPKKS